jgi:hypothetical protein
MDYKVTAKPKTRKKTTAKLSCTDATPYGGVSESSLPVRGTDKKVEQMLSDIVSRLDRIEEKIDDSVYPPESAIKPELIRQLKKAHADIKKGKGKTYNSIDDFFKEIEA